MSNLNCVEVHRLLRCIIWTEKQAAQIARERGITTTYVLWILHDDDVVGKHLHAARLPAGEGIRTSYPKPGHGASTCPGEGRIPGARMQG